VKNKKIIFLLTNRKHSGALKRVESFIDTNYEIEIYGFDRGFGKDVRSLKGIPVNDLGIVENGKHYFSKIINAYSIFNNIFKKNPGTTIYYVFSFDFAFICLLNKKKYVYEIRDLVYGYFSSYLIVFLFKFFDKVLIQFSLLTIVLSEGFVDFLYKSKSKSNIIVQPNKLHYFFKDKSREYPHFDSKAKITFGFIGIFRFPNTILRFARIVGENFPNYEFLFFGDGDPSQKKMIVDIANKYKNISYKGCFKNPNELKDIYKKIDVSLSCYDNNFINVRYAEPNKLYESIYFFVPIIVSENTFLGQKVSKSEVGFVINSSSDKEIIYFINELTFDKINQIKRNMVKYSLDDVIDDKAYSIKEYINNNG
jgi:succinoglycan biosynthesis protein ExoL